MEGCDPQKKGILNRYGFVLSFIHFQLTGRNVFRFSPKHMHSTLTSNHFGIWKMKKYKEKRKQNHNIKTVTAPHKTRVCEGERKREKCLWDHKSVSLQVFLNIYSFYIYFLILLTLLSKASLIPSDLQIIFLGYLTLFACQHETANKDGRQSSCPCRR